MAVVKIMKGTIKETHARIVVQFVPDLSYTREIPYELREQIAYLACEYDFDTETSFHYYTKRKLYILTTLLPAVHRFKSLIDILNSFRVLGSAAILIDIDLDINLLVESLHSCKIKKVGLYKS